jgi:hypothetical protein
MRLFVGSCVIFASFIQWGYAQKPVDEVQELVSNVFHLSEVMVHDVTNPPAASRFYAYALLGAYQVIASNPSQVVRLDELFHVKPSFHLPMAPDGFNKTFCASYTMLEVARLMMPSGYLIVNNQKQFVEGYKKTRGISTKVIANNIKYAQAVALQIIEYAKTDGYTKLSTLKRYSPKNTEGHWYPTPPEYMLPVEANWATIRPFFLESGSQFLPAVPTVFSTGIDSDFYKLLKEVHDTSTHLTELQKEIASFWDCNPFTVNYSGHISIGLKKISPGGHWMGITGIACKLKQKSFDSTVYAHTLVALTLHDSFISCWTEKYRSDRIRPESAINKYLDVAWRPMLQTPPFPEYPSGHSVISTASAEILSYLLGETVEYTDTSEEYFGLPPRSFNSFREAAQEAAVSRLYGGIHFRDAIEAGQDQGLSIAKYIIQKTEYVTKK